MLIKLFATSKHTIAPAIISLLLFIAAIFNIAAETGSLQYKPDYIISANYYQNEPQHLVMQVIDNRLYKWHESYDADNQLQIRLLKPVVKELTREESDRLLGRSRQWEEQYLQASANYLLRLENLADNRTSINNDKAALYPYNTIGFLEIKFSDNNLRGTGFLAGPHLVLTNAHNIYASSFGGWFSSIKFSPGQYETTYPEAVKPFSSASPVHAEANEQYLLYENSGDRDNSIKYDYAALFFTQPFAGINTFIPLQFNSQPISISLIGYPGFVRGEDSLSMWRSDGAIIASDNHCIYYAAYSSGGSSGSPVLVFNRDADTYRVVAIHSFAYAGDNNYGGGPHFNEMNRQIIEKWLRWEPSSPGQAIPVDVSEENDEAEPTQTIPVPDPSIINAGDINGDGIINVLDAVLALQHVLLLIELDEEILEKTDLNGDGIINIIDVTLIMQYAIGVIEIP